MLNSEPVRTRIRLLAAKRIDRLLPDSGAPSAEGAAVAGIEGFSRKDKSEGNALTQRKKYFAYKQKCKLQMEEQLMHVAEAMMEKSAARLDS